MPSFGHASQGAVKFSGISADFKVALKTVAPDNGVVTALYVDMQNDGPEIQAFRAGIYNDAPTISGASLVGSSDAVLLASGAPRQWVAFNSGIGATVIAGQSYWLTLHAGTTGGSASYWYDSGVGSQITGSDSFADGLGATFGTALSSTSNSLAVYADYVSTSAKPAGLNRVVFGRKYALTG